MYCPQQEYYQMPGDYQSYGTSHQCMAYTPTNMPNYTNDMPLYSPNSPVDRPSPSFRIDDIIQSKAGHPYAAMYQNTHFQGFPGNESMNHGCMLNKDYQGMGPPNGITSVPAYFRLKSNSRMVGGRKCRKPRTVFSELQLMILEREFVERKYLSTPQRTKLAERLGLNQTQVKTWYQNRRMKWKKETNETDTKKLKQMTTDDSTNEKHLSPQQHPPTQQTSII